MPRKIEISHKTIIFTFIVLLGVWLVYFLRQIILQVFVALLLMIIINPLVKKLAKYKIPRVVSVGTIYILVLAFLGLVVGLIFPILIEQTTNFASALPSYLQNIQTPLFSGKEIASQISQQLGLIPGQVLKVGVSFFSNIVSVLTVFVFAFYLLVAREELDEQLAVFLGESNSRRAVKIIDRLEEKLGGWARAEFILMTLVGALTYVGLLVLGINFALPLALLAGVMEVVPTLGPILSAIPAVLVGFSIHPVTGFGVAAMVFLIQQLENYVFVPRIMQESVGISPIVTLFALVVGFKIAGVAGAILAVPTAITLQVLGEELIFKK